MPLGTSTGPPANRQPPTSESLGKEKKYLAQHPSHLTKLVTHIYTHPLTKGKTAAALTDEFSIVRAFGMTDELTDGEFRFEAYSICTHHVRCLGLSKPAPCTTRKQNPKPRHWVSQNGGYPGLPTEVPHAARVCQWVGCFQRGETDSWSHSGLIYLVLTVG